MTENLALPLAQGTPVEASYGTTTESSISTFIYTPTSTAMNGSTANNTTYGWHYTWYAATAERNNSAGTGVDVNGSICPKGWRLPANYAINSIISWGALTESYLNITNLTYTNTGYLTLEATPLSLPRFGYYYNGSFNGGGSDGDYWSSTSYSTPYGQSLIFTGNRIHPQNYHEKDRYGFSARCLAVR